MTSLSSRSSSASFATESGPSLAAEAAPSSSTEAAASSVHPSLRALLSRRYAQSFDAGEAGANALPALAPLLSHHSVRQFLPDALPGGALELLVAAAQSASSSSNLQLWSVIDVADPERRRQLFEVAGRQAHILQCPAFLVWVADLHRPTELAEARGIGHAGLDYLEMFLMASIDTALAAQNAVVAAEALGLGVVYIGALRNDPERVARVLGLPPRAYAVFGLCVGWADPAAEGSVKPRLPQSVVLHRDHYGSVAEQQPTVAEYDHRMVAFYTEQRMTVPAGGWSVHSSERVATVAALRGRDRLRLALKALGFELR
jgi:nitroreductase